MRVFEQWAAEEKLVDPSVLEIAREAWRRGIREARRQNLAGCRRRYEQLVKAGRCVKCRDPSEGGVHCNACKLKVKRRKAELERRRQGL